MFDMLVVELKNGIRRGKIERYSSRGAKAGAGTNNQGDADEMHDQTNHQHGRSKSDGLGIRKIL